MNGGGLLHQGVSVPERFVRTWEQAYRTYGEASELAALSQHDPRIAQRMASASRHVASAWRNIATVRDLPWWVLAALESAAEAFEAQSATWASRANSDRAGGPS